MANRTQVHVELNDAGFRELLKSSEITSIIKGYADQIAGRCGTGYVSDTYNAGNRMVASVSTTDYESMKDEYENQTIEKALK